MTITNLIFSYFIPARLKEEVKDYHKAILLISIHLLLLIITFASWIAKLTNIVESNLPSGPILCLLIFLIVLFKKKSNFFLSGNLVAGLCAVALGKHSLTTGGIYSLDYVFMLIIPLLAYMLVNKKSGITWSILLIIYSIALFILEIFDIFLTFNNITIKKTYFELVNTTPNYHFVVSFLLFIFVLFAVYVFQQKQEDTINDLEEKSKTLSKQKTILEVQKNALEQQKNTLEKQKQELEIKEAALRKSNEELELYARITSHDFKQPLRSITSFSQLLKRHMKKQSLIDETASEYLDYIEYSSTNMNNLINDLLTYARLGNEADNNFQETDFNYLMKMVCKNLSLLIREKNITISYENLPESLSVTQTKITQVLQNIISNAIKFKHAERPCCIKIVAEDCSDHWQFAISDNGIGIQEEYFSKIFDLFRKLHSPKEYQGTGIGLSICKVVIEQHKGKIWLESKYGFGTTFFFTISKNLKTVGKL